MRAGGAICAKPNLHRLKWRLELAVGTRKKDRVHLTRVQCRGRPGTGWIRVGTVSATLCSTSSSRPVWGSAGNATRRRVSTGDVQAAAASATKDGSAIVVSIAVADSSKAR